MIQWEGALSVLLEYECVCVCAIIDCINVIQWEGALSVLLEYECVRVCAIIDCV